MARNIHEPAWNHRSIPCALCITSILALTMKQHYLFNWPGTAKARNPCVAAVEKESTYPSWPWGLGKVGLYLCPKAHLWSQYPCNNWIAHSIYLTRYSFPNRDFISLWLQLGNICHWVHAWHSLILQWLCKNLLWMNCICVSILCLRPITACLWGAVSLFKAHSGMFITHYILTWVADHINSFLGPISLDVISHGNTPFCIMGSFHVTVVIFHITLSAPQIHSSEAS